MTEQSQPDFAADVDTTLLDALGRRVYGDQWHIVRAHNVRRMKGDDPTPLGAEECQRLVNGLQKLDEMRRR